MIFLLVSRAFSSQEIITNCSPFIFPMSLVIIYIFVLLLESLNMKSPSLPTQKDSYSFDHSSRFHYFISDVKVSQLCAEPQHPQFHYSFTTSRSNLLTTLRLLSPSCCLSISPFSMAGGDKPKAFQGLQW